MRPKVIRAVLLIAIACALSAQTPSRTATGLETIKASVLRTDLTYIASDEMQGRLSLGPGSELAIKWIAAEFKKAGLKPLADNYLQTVPLIDYRSDRQANSLTVRRNGKEEVFHAPDATSNFPSENTVKGAVVFAGFGIAAPELRYDDYAGLDARGKIVLVFNHEPQEDDAHSIFNGRGNTRYANTRAKMTVAARHGAIALLIMPDPNHPPGMTRGRSAGQGGAQDKGAQGKQGAGRGGAPLRPQQALADDGSIPVFNISEKLGEDLLAVTERKPGEIQTDIDSTLKPQSARLPGIEVELHAATSSRRVANSYNVVGLLEGSDPQLAAETIVFSGHYDHDGPAPNGGIFHGADDNGSGTVGVVALARAFAKNPVKPKRSLLFIVFAAEERGLLGSYYYCLHPLRPLETTRAVINFDMIGRNEAASNQTNGLMEIAEDTSNELNLVGAKYSPDYKETVERANAAVGLKLNYKWDDDTVLNVLFRSDQYPFVMHDIPGFWWFTGFHPDYHQVTDTADKINYPKMEKILKLAFLAGFDFADAPNPPKFRAAGARN